MGLKAAWQVLRDRRDLMEAQRPTTPEKQERFLTWQVRPNPTSWIPQEHLTLCRSICEMPTADAMGYLAMAQRGMPTEESMARPHRAQQERAVGVDGLGKEPTPPSRRAD